MILEQIVSSTRKAVAETKSRIPLRDMEKAICRQAPPRNFCRALRGHQISLIAEVKRASPSKGVLRPNIDAASLAHVYSRSGAAAISVLAESKYFLGGFTDLEAVRNKVDLPLLCKHFIVDRYQVYQARAHGADAVLLIVAILTQDELSDLLDTIHSLSMAALIEVHSENELRRALKLSPEIIGINNRDLSNFNVDLETGVKLRHLIPQEVVVVGESGIHTRHDVLKLESAGIDAILVGEALVTSDDPARKIDELLGRSMRSII